MFFKLSRIVALGALSLQLAGCNLPLGEKPPETDPLQVGLVNSTACLSDVVPVFEKFFQAKALEPELIASFDCMNAAITTFEKSVSGRYEDRFTARELAHFFEQYFLEKGTRISPELLTEAFRIKQLFVGGNVDSLTREEMKNTLYVIQELKRLTLILNPHMKVYTFNWQVSEIQLFDVDVKTFEDANLAVQQAAKDLAVLIEKNGLPYRLQNVLVLLQELSAFSETRWGWIADIEKAMPLVEKLKKTLAGGEASEIAPTEWKRFALLGARGYVQYLRYYYFVKSKDFTMGGRQLVYFVRSVDDLFSYLGDMVGSKPDSPTLTRQELKEILEALSAFVPKLKISDALLVESMKIKVIFFGGGVDVFIQEDFERARAKLEAFRLLTEKFLNYSSVYSLAWKPEAMSAQDAQSYFKLAESNLTDFSERLGENMDEKYDLRDLLKLVEEIDKLYESPDGKPLKDRAEKFLPVALAAKNILFSDESTVIGANAKPQKQWSVFLKTAAELYSRYMYYHYFVSKEELLEEPGLTVFNRLLVDSTYFIDRLIEQKPSKVIAFHELSRLWAALKDGDFIKDSIKVSTLDKLTKVLVQKILVTPEDRLAGSVPQGLNLKSMENLRSEFSMWKDNQKFLRLVYRGVDPDEGKSGAALLADLNSASQTIPLLELKMIFSTPLPLSFDTGGRLYLSKPALNYRETTANTINLIRTAVRTVIRSYAMNLSRIRNYTGITKDEANALFEDVKPLVIDLELLSPGSTGFADNRFRDANLFMAVGNGDDLADYKEMSHLFVMILSGLKLDELLRKDLDQKCAIQKPDANKENWLVHVDCVLDLYAKETPRQLVSMPDYLKFIASLDLGRYRNMFISLVKAAGAVVNPEGLVKVDDLALYPHVIQYVEVVYQMYDADRNGQLTTPEALNAYPKYRQILKDVSGLKEEQQLKGLFTWLLKNGKAPEGAEKLQFLFWVSKGEAGWKINATREMLAKILGFIADEMAKPRTPGVLPMDLRGIMDPSMGPQAYPELSPY